ncbi:hypothetical protein NDU88_003574 [Pleurodeles waltl]|uniref:Uncharacterized protein n=1 Tax=Pleurodeles waltl TaxID=8319 RepID=A0AAV7VFZ4_PLEWA|nr:hypothetical protein NDU88_003574 [Pleurodeles waltl]
MEGRLPATRQVLGRPPAAPEQPSPHQRQRACSLHLGSESAAPRPRRTASRRFAHGFQVPRGLWHRCRPCLCAPLAPRGPGG